MTYNTNLILNYSDDFGYRQSIRDVFGMKCAPDSVNVDYDDVTRDELMYEADAISAGLDDIYERTKDVPEFQKIYSTCAGFMLSVDPNIGLAVVFSYDYFDKFHPCLVDFLVTGSISSDNRENLMKKISR
jgi:hypothetical protein